MKKVLICTLLLLFHFTGGIAQSRTNGVDLKSRNSILKRAFSEITLDDINSLRNTSYASSDQKRVDDFLNKYALYTKAKETLCYLDGWREAKGLREQIIPYLDKKKKDNPKKGFYAFSSEQFNEMDSLDIALSRFKGGIETFKSFIRSVDWEIAKWKNASGNKKERKAKCINAINRLISDSEAGKNMRQRYSVVNVLDEMFRDYCEERCKHPFNKSKKSTMIEQKVTNIYIE